MLENICWYGTTFSLTVTPLCSDSNFLTSSVKEVSSDLLAQVVNVSEPESPPPLPLPPPKPEQPLRVSAGARAIPMRAADLFLLNFTLRSPYLCVQVARGASLHHLSLWEVFTNRVQLVKNFQNMLICDCLCSGLLRARPSKKPTRMQRPPLPPAE